MAERRRIPPIHHMLERAKLEVPLLGATAEEIRALRPMAQTGVEAVGARLKHVEGVCLFIGHPRSGHSLVGAMLDAHPDLCIAHELDMLAFLRQGWTDRELMWACMENSRRSASIGHRWGAYAYQIPGQWQGRQRQLRIVGDKKGGQTSIALRRNPGLLDRLLSTFDVPVRWIHVVRNPWDNISTVQKKHRTDLQTSAAAFFAVAETVDQVVRRVGRQAVHRLTQEELTAEPERVLRDLSAFLGMAPDPAWLQASAGLVWSKPSRARDRVQWNPGLHGAIRKLAARHDWLAHYRFDE